jgi:2-polyprenyl-6-methoxyphenol hydroxylase-like FAD-dependent oxidoreductase
MSFGKKRPQIAIIGAGYAGLALANLLIGDKCYDVTLFEGLHRPPDEGGLVGTISLPCLTKYFRKLGWAIPDNDCHAVPEEKVRKRLRKSVDSCIRYWHVCYSLQESADGHVTLLLWYRKTDECFESTIHYDLVVVCNGVRSERLLKQSSLHSACNRVVLLGDARHVDWDFGKRRLQQGANQAILDAMEFGDILLEFEDLDSVMECKWGKFSAQKKLRQIVKQRIAGLFLVLLSIYLYLQVTRTSE